MTALIANARQDHHPAPVIRFAGHAFLPLPSGALFWQQMDTLLVADLHLEKMSSFVARGLFLPPYDSYATLRQLGRDIEATGASRLISLGDSFHRDSGTGTLPPDARALLDQLISEIEWTWIAGNHDPAPHELGGTCCDELEVAGITLTHEPSNIRDRVIAGHLHPAARVYINGRSTRRPCFAADERLLLMPAYGVSTGSLNILSDPFTGLFDRAELKVMMLGRDAVYPVSVHRLVRG
ncbi:MAG: ligase-associated DNA damage response endonuclease PdeM [Hyphomicrobiaceae bacterium]|nr:ligase-associated DNA damage response endonuclease PdeM [Hyphomicrobiaceae bacterium]